MEKPGGTPAGQGEQRGTARYGSAGVALVDPASNTIMQVNPAFARMHGYAPGELRGVGFTDLDADPAAALARWADATRDDFVTESEHVRRDGTRFPVRVEVTTVLGSEDSRQVRIANVQDLTVMDPSTRKQRFLAETGSALGQSLDYTETLQRLAWFAVPAFADWCMVDLITRDGGFRRLSVACADPAMRETAARLEREYGPPRDASHGVARVAHTAEPELIPDVRDALLVAVSRDDEHLALLRSLDMRSYICVPLTTAGRTFGALSFVRTGPSPRYEEEDLDLAAELGRRASMAIEHARLYRDVQQANIAKAEFLATMSHELRTPLTGILGYAELLRAGIVGQVNETQAHHLDRVVECGRHLLMLIEEILEFAKVDVGALRATLRTIRPERVLRTVWETVAPLASARQLTLEVQSEPDLPRITTDPHRLRQILINLAGNAIKFTNTGTVRLSAVSEGDRILFSVEDTGIGIARDHLDRIFEPFWQVEQSATRNVGGTGLGLSVARKMAHLLGGDISVASTPGRGSVFTVRLPISGPRGLDRRSPGMLLKGGPLSDEE